MQDIKLLAPRAFKKANKYGGFTWKAGVGVGAPMRGIWLEGLFGWGSSRLVGLASPACTGECGGSVVVMGPWDLHLIDRSCAQASDERSIEHFLPAYLVPTAGPLDLTNPREMARMVSSITFEVPPMIPMIDPCSPSSPSPYCCLDMSPAHHPVPEPCR